MNIETTSCVILSILVLIIISKTIGYYPNTRKYFSTTVGSIIMAFGIFVLYALPELPFSNNIIINLATLELLILWIYIAINILVIYLKGDFSALIHGVNNNLGVGTWVASSAVLAMLLFKIIPTYHVVNWIIALIPICIWIAYLWLIIPKLLCINTLYINSGIIFLITVSTQSIVLLLNALLPNHISTLINLVLILSGYIFYVFSLIVIIRYCFSIKPKRLLLSWSNTNSIIHGALSISGLASLIAASINDIFIIFTWFMATCLFITVEAISLIGLYYRIRIVDIKKGARVYEISQWSRIFTYGMYYAFTLSISHHKIISNLIIDIVTAYGQYIVLIMLILEIIILTNDKFFAPIE